VPLLYDGAQLWCGRLHREGRQELWTISNTHGAITIVCYLRDADGQPWERRQWSALGLDLVGALHQLTDLLELSPVVISRFVIGPDPTSAGQRPFHPFMAMVHLVDLHFWSFRASFCAAM
jgi:hypothetical protein